MSTATYDKRQAAEEFSRWSESYDRCVLQWLLFGPSHRAMIGRIRARFGDRPIRVLDIGCGTGLFAARLREALPGARVTGVDLVSGMLARGRERWRKLAETAAPVQGDSERLPFDSAAFDVVTCANSFHHYPHQDRAVAEMRRVLRPGGRLILVDGYRDAPYGWLIYDVCVALREGNVHHCSRARVRALMEAAGLGAVEQKVHRGFAPFLLSEAEAPDSPIRAPHFRVAARGAGSGAARRP
jgi:ubiquinone/menaquinone biosynthesis C-methylase UbiE